MPQPFVRNFTGNAEKIGDYAFSFFIGVGTGQKYRINFVAVPESVEDISESFFDYASCPVKRVASKGSKFEAIIRENKYKYENYPCRRGLLMSTKAKPDFDPYSYISCGEPVPTSAQNENTSAEENGERKEIVDLVIPASKKIIQKNAYENCETLKTITLSKSLERIEESAFRNCPAISEIVFGDKLSYIGARAFQTTEKKGYLKTLTIPGSVKHIGDQAFDGSIKHWVNGHNSPGSLEIVSQIASYFNVKTEQLLMPVQIESEEYNSLEELRYYGSTMCYIREHLIIKAAEAEKWAAEQVRYIMLDRLGEIGRAALLDSNRLWELQITVDGQTLHFQKGVGLDELKQVIMLLHSAKDIDLYMDYDFSYPFEMAEYLDTLEREEMKGIFYSMYHVADGNTSLGPLLAYGERNGSFYSGSIIELKQTEDTPAETVWDSVHSDIFCDTDQLEGFEEMDQAAISKICHALTDSFDTEDYSPVLEDETGIEYFLNNPVLRGDNDVKRYIALVGELVRLTDDQIYRPSVFVEVGPSGPRTMQIDFDRQGNATVWIAQV